MVRVIKAALGQVLIIVGLQWGDEGKGKLTDIKSRLATVVIRYQGGPNAGHTVCREEDGRVFKLSSIPSGILTLHGPLCIIGAGAVLNPILCAAELRKLIEEGIDATERLRIDRNAHLILPYHRHQDKLSEDAKATGGVAINTTKQGIGPAYADKAFRSGLRAGDMCREGFFDFVAKILQRKKVLAEGYYEAAMPDWSGWHDELQSAIELLAPLVCDTVSIVRETLDGGGAVLAEGAQGTLLDIDYGTYPYVTSSHPTSGGALLGTGISLSDNIEVVGVAKVGMTRVGNGPFPTRDIGSDGQSMQYIGEEFGTVTGRVRDCGWLDGPLLRYATVINGCTTVALMKLDVLDTFERVKLCVAHQYPDGTQVTWPDLARLDEVTPVYEEFTGWQCNTTGIRDEADIPMAMRAVLARIEEFLGIPVSLISVGKNDTAFVSITKSQASYFEETASAGD